jgi:4-hydroxy-3-polyprenylbenzoate decarboxylase/2,5-furandicarboxylate decarboxylase 1
MAYKDLREFLAACKEAGDLIEVNRPISTDLEIGKALKKSYVENGPVIIFNNLIDKSFPAVGGVFGNRAKALRAFKATNDDVHEKFIQGLNNPIDPIIVENAPCQECVLTGDDIDLFRLPIPRFSPRDGGAYVTAGITVSKDPESGVPDIGHYRYQLHDKNTFGYFAQPFHRFGKNCIKAKALGMKKLEAAIVIGTDPVLGYTCQIKQVADDVNDWTLAGGLRGEAVELVKCKTIDLEVPAYAEFIIEIEVDFTQTRPEGPLGEYTGYMTPASDKNIAHVKAITHRQDPLFQVLLTGKPITENHILKNIPFEASFLNAMKKEFPTISAVSIRPSGGVQLYVVIAMKPRYAGEARHAILAAISSNVRPKWVIVVDPDINVYDAAEVEWAMSYRVVPGRDIVIVKDVPSAPLDPSSRGGEDLQAKLNDVIGIDATLPFGEKFAEVADVPGWKESDFPELKR